MTASRLGGRGAPLAALAALIALLATAVLGDVPAFAATPPVIEEASVLNVSATGAELQAQIDPEGASTSYHFEYGPTTSYGAIAPAPSGAVGSGTSGVTVGVQIEGLAPDTEYHYRVIATGDTTVDGADGTFVTQSGSSEFALPDNRVWEMVSPSNKRGGSIYSRAAQFPIQAATGGGAITYPTTVPPAAEPAGNALVSQLMSTRGANGWTTQDISPKHEALTGVIDLTGSEFLAFDEELTASLAYPHYEDRTLLSPLASEPTPYLRTESLCQGASASECFLPLLTGREGYADVLPGAKFGLTGGGVPTYILGWTPNFSHVLLSSGVDLTEPTTTHNELYEWSAGQGAAALQMASIMPADEGGEPATGASLAGATHFVGSGTSAPRHPIVDEGTRVFWENSQPAPSSEFDLYMRDTAKHETIRLDVKQSGAPSGGSQAEEGEPSAQFQYANPQGTDVLFEDAQRLTEHSGKPAEVYRGGDLYLCEITERGGKDACNLTDLTPETNGQSAQVQGVVSGVSSDGSYVYFVANGALAPGASPGDCSDYNSPHPSVRCNLYLLHYNGTKWEPPRFIAQVSNADQLDWGSESWGEFSRLTAEASPNGRYFAFMSDLPLTGYDTRDALNGLPDEEVYLYDAAADGGEGRLVCASCNPTGARPYGAPLISFYEHVGLENYADVTDNEEAGTTGVAANLPTAETLHQPRYMLDDGRLLFNSTDALVPQDVDGTVDVYEFEPEGIGSCSATASTFSPKTGGCTSLISAGTSPAESGLLDASESGGDVFFLTKSQLSPADRDEAGDVYDAHECTSASPCSAPLAAAPPCSTADSCRPAPTPQPALFGPAASATFSGLGDLAPAPPPASSSSAGRRANRMTKLQRALKHCDAEFRHSRRKRQRCERQERRSLHVSVARDGRTHVKNGSGRRGR